MTRKCPICHSAVPLNAKKCRHCHNYLGFSFQWVWEEGVRVLGLVSMIAAALVAWKSLEVSMQAQRQRQEAVASADLSLREREALKEDLLAPSGLAQLQTQALSSEEKTLVRAAEESSDVRVRKMLAGALELKRKNVPFRMGGKSPEEGFDSSGFVSYLLGECGALDPLYHSTFSVARLAKTFPKIEESKAKPGDLVFLDAGFVAIHIGHNLAVGIGGDKGIHVLSFFPKAKKTYHRWAYEQEAKGLK
jgi:cell wall-associated NlpC family hydrolase